MQNFDPGRIDRERLIYVATVVRPHGLLGTLKVKVESDNPLRFAPQSRLLLVQGERITPVEVESFSDQNRFGLLKLKEVISVEQAEALKHAELAVMDDELKLLPPGEYYTFQIIGLKVISEQGQELGQIIQVEEYPAGDIYLVQSGTGKFYVPAKGPVILKIDLEQGRMVIRDLEGLR
ncbi:MAG: ribosome maturation factor RimM [bacterium]|nr:ribosome maturation factor RimM [bacterium]